jgi:molybdate transport system ATP-binding protein
MDLDLRFARGGFELDLRAEIIGAGVTAIMGPNGAGKSTLLRLIAGFETPQSGHIRVGDTTWFDGAKGQHSKPWQRPLGMVFQGDALFAHLDVAGNLAFADRRAKRLGGTLTLSGVIEALELGPLLKQSPATLSGGERQRVALGRALLTRPDWLLLDEPLTALDRDRRGDILPYLREALRAFDIPALLVSHSLDDVAELADHVLMLSNGRKQSHGPVDTILARYDVETADGRRDPSSLIKARVTGHDAAHQLTHLEIDGHRLDMPLMDDVGIGAWLRLRIRARDVALALERPEGTSIRNILPVTIADIQTDEDGPFGHAVLHLGNTRIRARLTRASIHDLGLKPDQNAFALIRSVSFDR